MTSSMPAATQRRKVIVGVDTHKHVHVAVAIDVWGIRLEDRSFAGRLGRLPPADRLGRRARPDRGVRDRGHRQLRRRADQRRAPRRSPRRRGQPW